MSLSPDNQRLIETVRDLGDDIPSACIDTIAARLARLEALELFVDDLQLAFGLYYADGPHTLLNMESRLRALLAPELRESMTAWLIERGQAEKQRPTVWLVDSGASYTSDWTTDANKATRYPTKDEAEAVLHRYTHPTRGASARAVEHAWLEREEGSA